MASAVDPLATSHDVQLYRTGLDAEPEDNPPFTKKDLVFVEARTWPGINKPGGVGKVVSCTCVAVTVKYIMGGTDKDIPLTFVTLNSDLEKRQSKAAKVLNVEPEAVNKRAHLAEVDTNIIKKPKAAAGEAKAATVKAPTVKAAPAVKKAKWAKPALPAPSPASSLASLAEVCDRQDASPLSTGARITELTAMASSSPSSRPTSTPAIPLPLMSAYRALLAASFARQDDTASIAALQAQWRQSGHSDTVFDGALKVMCEQNVVMVDGDDIYKI